MIDRQTQQEVEALWREARSVQRSNGARLDAMIEAFLITMRIVIEHVESVQTFWDNADMLAVLNAASEGEALDEGGRITKEAVLKYQVLFLAFNEFTVSAASADVLGQTVTLSETPKQLILRQPERI